MDQFTRFNFLEGLFWILLGALFFVWFKFSPEKSRRPLAVAGFLLVLFGLSDWIEILTGGFIPGPGWLLLWKMLNLLGFLAVIIYYFRLRR